MKIFFTLLSLLLPSIVYAQWTPFISNYDKSLFGKGAQIWQISPSNKMFNYYANQKGVVQFDGTNWTLYPMNNGTYARSVLVSDEDKRVYVGGVNEYGWLEVNDNGHLSYKCISDTLDNEIRYLGNVWSVQRSSTCVYYVGDSKFVKLFNGEVSMIDAGFKLECSAMVDDVLYLGTDHGVYILIGKNLYPLQGGDMLEDKVIKSMVPFQQGLLIATTTSELFVYKKGILTPYSLPDEVNATDLFCIATNDSKIAIGTILQGVYIIDVTTGDVLEFNESNGLQNNTVLSLSFDNLGNLWAGLDSGIDYIYLNIPCTNLYTSRNTCGAGYAAAVEDNIIYLGTNRGLYYTTVSESFKPDLSKLKMIAGTGGQVWNISHVGSDLFCMHDKGLMLIHGNTIEKIGKLNGVWCCQQIAGHDDMLYVGTYDGLFVLEKNNGQWRVSHRVEGEGGSFQIFEQETAQELWLLNGRGVSCLKISDDLKKFTERTDYTKREGLPKVDVFDVSKVHGRVYFSTQEGIYKYNHHSDQFEVASDLNDLLSGQSTYYSLHEYHPDTTSDVPRIIAMSQDEIFMTNLTPFKNAPNTSSFSLPVYQSLISIATDFATVIPISDSLFIVPNDKGFALFNTTWVKNQHAHKHPFSIRNVVSTTPVDSVLYESNFIGHKVSPTIPYEMNSLRFIFKTSVVCTENIMYRCRLTGSQWSPWSAGGEKEYSDIHEGRYTFEVEARIGNSTVEYDSIEFTVLAPWYRTFWANILYMLLAFGMIAGLFFLERRRVLQKERIIAQEKDEQMAARELEFEQQQQQHKNQEMANLMINLARKNEMLGEIKEEIIHVVSSLKAGDVKGGSRELLMLNGKIDNNIENDDLLKRIEEQFDLVHNKFMQRLSERHPDLSNNERMMCAYLKMNLSTKEIAPLLNISVRGVESMRYRLRKKIGLDRDEGLMAYLTEEFD